MLSIFPPRTMTISVLVWIAIWRAISAARFNAAIDAGKSASCAWERSFSVICCHPKPTRDSVGMPIADYLLSKRGFYHAQSHQCYNRGDWRTCRQHRWLGCSDKACLNDVPANPNLLTVTITRHYPASTHFKKWLVLPVGAGEENRTLVVSLASLRKIKLVY